MNLTSSKNSFAQGWLWFKQSLGLLRSERRISIHVFLYAFSFLALSLVGTYFSIAWAPVIHLAVVPLMGYFYCRLYERVALGNPHEQPLVARLRTQMGSFLLMGFAFAVFSLLNSLAIKTLPTDGPIVQAIAVALGALLAWILSLIMNIVVWLMAVKASTPSNALSMSLTAIVSHLRSLVSNALCLMLVLFPSVVLVLLLLAVRLLALQNASLFGGAQTTSLIFSLLTLLTSLATLFSFLMLLALNVFSTFVICRDLFDAAPEAALENPSPLT